MNFVQAIEFVGGLSKPSKMPCEGYSISAKLCKTGSKLREIPGSTCSKCYAFRGNYPFPHVQAAMQKRFESIFKPEWVSAMTIAIEHSNTSGFFRWHDSGDIQNLKHLEKIVQIAKNLPKIKFWLPTREYQIVSEFVKKYGGFPDNLTVRLSAYMMESKGPETLAKKIGVTVSGVWKEGFTCPASFQDNKCLTCRACWDKNTFEVAYKKH